MRRGQFVVFAGILLCLWIGGCASTSKATLSDQEEARYREAIENSDSENESSLQPGQTVVINYGSPNHIGPGPQKAAAPKSNESVPENESISDIRLAEPVVPARDFEVPVQEYESFFDQSPAVILARMRLEPIMDGTALLGYRITAFTKPFPSVDIKVEDIIVGINGKMPRNPDDYFKQWQTAQKAHHCTVNIQRGVERFNLNWKTAE